jgi:Bacterial PH domain
MDLRMRLPAAADKAFRKVHLAGAGVTRNVDGGAGQGITGKKRDFTSLPYSKIQAFSIETAGTFDLDAELDLWLSGLGKVRLEFRGNADIRQLGLMIATYVL